jgi:hypothetical protein
MCKLTVIVRILINLHLSLGLCFRLGLCSSCLFRGRFDVLVRDVRAVQSATILIVLLTYFV